MAPRKVKTTETPAELPEVILFEVPETAPIAQALAPQKLIAHPSPSPSPAPSSHGPIVTVAVAVAVLFDLIGGRK